MLHNRLQCSSPLNKHFTQKYKIPSSRFPPVPMESQVKVL